MSGYRRVNYYELCRLCTSSEGNKMHLFREEGRRRQLPNKIQCCLPLQVNENDSLPKIICNQCAEKLESFFDFRASCVNAEAMLESYFTSLRYSDDFIREGKVYVKEVSPVKRKGDTDNKTSDLPASDTNALVPASGPRAAPVAVPASVESLNNLVQTAAIQIVAHSNAGGTRVQQYKCAMQLQQPGSVKTALVETAASSEGKYSYHSLTNMPPSSIGVTTMMKTEDTNPNSFSNRKPIRLSVQEIHNVLQQSHNQHSTQTEQQPTQLLSSEGQDHHRLSQQQQQQPHHLELRLQQNHVSPVSCEGGDTDGGIVTMQQAITFASPTTGQDMLLHFGFNKDKDFSATTAATLFRTDESMQRASTAQIGEFLRMKTMSVEEVEEVEEEEGEETGEDGAGVVEVMMEGCSCDQCGKELNGEEAHSCSDVANDDKVSRDTTYSCDICGKLFKRKEHLYQHSKLHTGERPYGCGYCGKAFSRKEHLVRHSVSHTGQKVHSCEMCGKTFSRKDNLHKHRKTHGISGPYICDACGKSFVVKHYYLMHKATHAASEGGDDPLPYRCDICNKGFSVKHYLTTHKMRHRNRLRTAMETLESSSDEGVEEITVADPLALPTINAAALLPPNSDHHTTNSSPVYQITSGSTTSYICTPAASQLIETYRRLNSST